jgi:hypothetical protein
MAVTYTPEQQAAITKFSQAQPIVYNEWLNGAMWDTSTGTRTYVPFADYVMKKSQLDITTPTPTPVSPVEQARRIAEANRQAQARLLQIDPNTNKTEDVAGNAARNALMNKVQAETAKIQNPSLQTPSVSSATSPVGANGQPTAPITAKQILQTNKEAETQQNIKQEALKPTATPEVKTAAANITKTQEKLNALPSIGTPVAQAAPAMSLPKQPAAGGTTTPAPKAPNINVVSKPIDYTQTGTTSQASNDLMAKANVATPYKSNVTLANAGMPTHDQFSVQNSAGNTAMQKALQKKVTLPTTIGKTQVQAGTFVEPEATDLGPKHTQFKGATDVSSI